MLAIAGSGPLPLWLHNIVCHGQHSGCSHSHQAAKPGTHTHAGCGHDHGLASHATEPNAAQPNASGMLGKQFVQWQAVDQSHEDCAVCYTLSQLTTSQPTDSTLVAHLFSHYVGPHADAQADVVSLWAYSSRGPPV